MRALLWFSAGFCGACAAFAYLPGMALIPGLAGLFVGAAIAILLGTERLRRRLLCALLGCVLGLGWFWAYDGVCLAPAKALDGQTRECSVTLLDYSSAAVYGQTAQGRITLNGRTYRLRLYMDGEEALPPGTVLEGAFRFRLTTGSGAQARTANSGRGEFLIAYGRGEARTRLPEKREPAYLAAYLRHAILDKLQSLFSGDAAAFARALLLGDTAQLRYELDTAFQVSGVRHVVAVSGLHVSILCALLLFLSRGRQGAALALCLPALALFAAMAGFTPSVVRAGLMMLLLLLSGLVRREYDPPTALSFAVLIILLGNPWAVASVGFQLSVSSVAGILFFSRRIRRALERPLRRWNRPGKRLLSMATASVSVTLGATVLSAPLSAYYFGMVSLAGVLTNLLGLWMISLIFYGILISILLGWLFLPLGQLAAFGTTLLIRCFLGLTRAVAAVPAAAVYTQSPAIAAWLALCCLLLILLLLMKKKPAALFAGICAFSLAAALAVSWLLPLRDTIRVSVLDVGQGQCVVVRGSGRVYLVDCGGDYGAGAADTAAEYLLSQGVFRLDGMIFTHLDDDHVNGAAYLASRLPVDAVFYPAAQEPELTAGAFYPITARTALSFGACRITLFPGQAEAGNGSSLCVLCQAGEFDALITGDQSAAGEERLLQQAALPELEVLVVGHHGSKTSTGEALLEATRPKYAVISVGGGNPYGHPAQEVLERLEEYGCTILRTDEDGTILFRG